MAHMIATFNKIFYCPFILLYKDIMAFLKEKEKLRIPFTVGSIRSMVVFPKMEKSLSGRLKQKTLWMVVLNKMKTWVV